MENSVYFYLFVSVDTFHMSVQIQFALKILKMRIKNILTCYSHYWIWCSWLVGWLCWGLTSQSTIFQSCRDGATASWVINQYFRAVNCLAQGHNTAAVGFEPPTSRSRVWHSTTEPPRSPMMQLVNTTMVLLYSCNSEHLPFVFAFLGWYPLYNTEGIIGQDVWCII